jgi:hypothetical protein
VCDEFSAQYNGQRARRKSACGNSGFQDLESITEASILRSKITHEK